MSTISLRRYLILQFLGDRLNDGVEFTTTDIVNLLLEYDCPFKGNQRAAIWNVLRAKEFEAALKREHGARITRVDAVNMNKGSKQGGRSIIMLVVPVPRTEADALGHIDEEVEEWMPA